MYTTIEANPATRRGTRLVDFSNFALNLAVVALVDWKEYETPPLPRVPKTISVTLINGEQIILDGQKADELYEWLTMTGEDT